MIKKNTDWEPDIIGLHGQTIFHDANEKLSVQLGDGSLLSQLTKKTVVYDFRQNDLKNGGQGAPLTPIFHQIIKSHIEDNWWPVLFLNIGGISNVTSTSKQPSILSNNNLDSTHKVFAGDIASGNCLIDEWIRKNSKKKYDKNGLIARSGIVDELVLNQALENFTENSNYKKSLDVKDFDIFFAKGLSLENGAATITNFTATLISNGMKYSHIMDKPIMYNWLVCGGGRKNKYLLESIKDTFEKINIQPIDEYEIDGDFVESQAFGYLAIRSFLKLPISFPSTTGCIKPSIGGVLVKNF